MASRSASLREKRCGSLYPNARFAQRRGSLTLDGTSVARIVSDLLLLHASAVRERLGRYSGHELGPPFSLSVLLVPLRLFARVLPLLLPLMLQLRLLLRRNPAPPINIYADLLSSISRCASEKRPDSSIHRRMNRHVKEKRKVTENPTKERRGRKNLSDSSNRSR